MTTKRNDDEAKVNLLVEDYRAKRKLLEEEAL